MDLHVKAEQDVPCQMPLFDVFCCHTYSKQHCAKCCCSQASSTSLTPKGVPRLTAQVRTGPALVPDLRQREHGMHTCAGAGVGDAGEEAGEVAEEVARGLLRAQLERHAGRLHDDPLRQGGLRPCSAAWAPCQKTEAGNRNAGVRASDMMDSEWYVAGCCQLLRRTHPVQSL